MSRFVCRPTPRRRAGPAQSRTRGRLARRRCGRSHWDRRRLTFCGCGR